MLIAELGQRYERLLFFTAPLSLAAFIVLAVTFASTRLAPILTSQCLQAASSVAQQQVPYLKGVWRSARNSASRGQIVSIEYPLEVDGVFGRGNPQLSGCYELLRPIIKKHESLEPEKLAAKLAELASVAAEEPVEMYGMTLPRNTTIDVFGNQIRVELITLAKILQVVLFPVLMLWLGSLYQTRQREAMHIAKVADIESVYPHFVNMFFSHHRKNRLESLSAGSWEAILTFSLVAAPRALLVAMFVLPPTAAYVASLFFTATDSESTLVLMVCLLAIALCSVFALMMVTLEFGPHLFRKVFLKPFDPGSC